MVASVLRYHNRSRGYDTSILCAKTGAGLDLFILKRYTLDLLPRVSHTFISRNTAERTIHA